MMELVGADQGLNVVQELFLGSCQPLWPYDELVCLGNLQVKVLAKPIPIWARTAHKRGLHEILVPHVNSGQTGLTAFPLFTWGWLQMSGFSTNAILQEFFFK